MTNIRVRFAPSPTGFLHIGGARTALFNWLFARKMGGTFILRIEDTDEVRSTEDSVNAIFHSLRWLGLDWDEGPSESHESWVMGHESQSEKILKTHDARLTTHDSKGNRGPYYQMQRLDLYRKYADQLLSEGKAYLCYCAPEELEEMRKKAMAKNQSPKYDGRCRDLTESQKKELQSSGRKPVVRFKIPLEGITRFEDIIRGSLEFENALLEDFVLLKASEVPTYQFAVVVDDYLMKITHVLRGDDHLSNTPRQILVYEALGWAEFVRNLKFAHFSMILGSDGSRLSKRHGATSVEEYERMGYLPEAMRNYLVLLGWSTEDSQQIFEKDELIEKFSIERCGKSAAVFDPQKLLWMNGEYVRKADVEYLTRLSMPFLKKAGLIESENPPAEEYRYLKSCIALEQGKIKLLSDAPRRIDFLIKDDYDLDPKALEKILKTPNVSILLSELKVKMQNLESFNAQKLEELFRNFAAEKNMKTSPIFHAVRVATSGRAEGPSLFHYLELLGKEKVMCRIDKTLATINSHSDVPS